MIDTHVTLRWSLAGPRPATAGKRRIAASRYVSIGWKNFPFEPPAGRSCFISLNPFGRGSRFRFEIVCPDSSTLPRPGVLLGSQDSPQASLSTFSANARPSPSLEFSTEANGLTPDSFSAQVLMSRPKLPILMVRWCSFFDGDQERIPNISYRLRISRVSSSMKNWDIPKPGRCDGDGA